ncbi:MAG: dienelactone hydrolase family protein [Oscillospiraceae bacterium]|nr:dienelactone hydrolase family protein [Oscillospiraceae bacterium]
MSCWIDYLTKTQDGRYRCIIISPQTPSEALSLDKDILTARMGIVRLVQETYDADRSRLYTTGFSTGGGMIWHLLATDPDAFAAAAPVSSMKGDPAQAEKMKDVPVWAFQGKWDLIYPYRKARKMTDALQAAGGNLKVTAYEYAGHVCWLKAYTDPAFLPWMFSQSAESRGTEG